MGSIHKTKSLPRRGYRTQPRVLTLGTRPPKATRSEGGAIERPSRAEAESGGPIVERPN
jgi:hypothetical protein